jgi:hypothetical protein|tara:strand:+ start:151 stop:393 length:243 start_codon:yes stop_codon:yes gene_type:complete
MLASSFSLHHRISIALCNAKDWKNWKHVLRLSASGTGFTISGGLPNRGVPKQVQDDESDRPLLLLRTNCKDSGQNGAICG